MKTKHNDLLSFFLFLALPLLLPMAANATSCKLNGDEVVPDCFRFDQCGQQSGRMRCTQSNGQPFGEWDIKQGKHIGAEIVYDDAGGRVEQTVDAQGHPQGTVRKYAPDGKLQSEQAYVQGQLSGKTASYFPDGKTERLGWWENDRLVFDVKYTPDGGVAHLLCGDKPYTDEAATLCGFKGAPSRVVLRGSGQQVRTVSYVNGKAVSSATADSGGTAISEETSHGDSKISKEYFPDGKLKIQRTTKDGISDGMETEYFKSGQMARQTLWQDGEKVTEDAFYQNGQKKAHMERSRSGDHWAVTEQLFHDNGKIEREGNYRSRHPIEDGRPYHDGDGGYDPTGEHRYYNDRGELTSSYFYDDNAHVQRIKTWSTDGRLQSDDAVFEDGSKKSLMR